MLILRLDIADFETRLLISINKGKMWAELQTIPRPSWCCSYCPARCSYCPRFSRRLQFCDRPSSCDLVVQFVVVQFLCSPLSFSLVWSCCSCAWSCFVVQLQFHQFSYFLALHFIYRLRATPSTAEFYCYMHVRPCQFNLAILACFQ